MEAFPTAPNMEHVPYSLNDSPPLVDADLTDEVMVNYFMGTDTDPILTGFRLHHASQLIRSEGTGSVFSTPVAGGALLSLLSNHLDCYVVRNACLTIQALLKLQTGREDVDRVFGGVDALWKAAMTANDRLLRAAQHSVMGDVFITLSMLDTLGCFHPGFSLGGVAVDTLQICRHFESMPWPASLQRSLLQFVILCVGNLPDKDKIELGASDSANIILKMWTGDQTDIFRLVALLLRQLYTTVLSTRLSSFMDYLSGSFGAVLLGGGHDSLWSRLVPRHAYAIIFLFSPEEAVATFNLPETRHWLNTVLSVLTCPALPRQYRPLYLEFLARITCNEETSALVAEFGAYRSICKWLGEQDAFIVPHYLACIANATIPLNAEVRKGISDYPDIVPLLTKAIAPFLLTLDSLMSMYVARTGMSVLAVVMSQMASPQNFPALASTVIPFARDVILSCSTSFPAMASVGSYLMLEALMWLDPAFHYQAMMEHGAVTACVSFLLHPFQDISGGSILPFAAVMRILLQVASHPNGVAVIRQAEIFSAASMSLDMVLLKWSYSRRGSQCEYANALIRLFNPDLFVAAKRKLLIGQAMMETIPSFVSSTHVCNICSFGDADDAHSVAEFLALPCCHFFHTECMLAWFQEGSPTCPLCTRSVVDMVSEVEVL